ncbi:MAG: SAM-dependent methyltransferase [Gammaproteobacteria bacterium]
MREDLPSSTAALIAAATLFLARDSGVSDLVPEGAAIWCARCLEALSPSFMDAVRTVSNPALRWAPRLAERMTVPGLMVHFMLRKRWIEAAVRASVDDGCQQVVVVGAGFDTLALRLCEEFPRVHFTEIDHPATQKYKRLAVERQGPAGNLHFIAADLARQSLEDVLSASEWFQPDARSTFVIEGLLMYLSDDDVAVVFGALSAVSLASGRIVFTVMEPTPDGRAAFQNATPLVRRLLSHWSEPFKSSLPRDAVPRFLDAFGFSLLGFATAETLRSRYLTPAGQEDMILAQGEMIVVAERKGSG